MSERLKIGVIGTGSLGKQHTRIYKGLASEGELELVGIYDTCPVTARAVASQYDVASYRSLEALAEAANAFSVVTPTRSHFEVARPLLQQGKHLLVEKPITETTAQATELIELARKHDCTLQVGHIERFNPVFRYLSEQATHPGFIEGHRLSPFPKRSIDIGVVLDLMIHDLDIVLSFVQSPVESVQAVGVPVLSPSEDIANARLRFANGCIANLTASRVSPEQMRKIRVFSSSPSPCYISLNYRTQRGFLYRLAQQHERNSSLWQMLLRRRDATLVTEFGGQRIVREPVPLRREEPLKLELQSFIDCIRAQETPQVSGEAGKQALELALEITRQIQSIPQAESGG